MAKKQTRRSISVSRTTYERLKAFCETNNISMSQLVENRVNDFLGGARRPHPAPHATNRVRTPRRHAKPVKPSPRPATTSTAPQIPMTSAARTENPPPIIKPKQQENAPKPAEKRGSDLHVLADGVCRRRGAATTMSAKLSS
jgi:hypothetical protein